MLGGIRYPSWISRASACVQKIWKGRGRWSWWTAKPLRNKHIRYVLGRGQSFGWKEEEKRQARTTTASTRKLLTSWLDCSSISEDTSLSVKQSMLISLSFSFDRRMCVDCLTTIIPMVWSNSTARLSQSAIELKRRRMAMKMRVLRRFKVKVSRCERTENDDIPRIWTQTHTPFWNDTHKEIKKERKTTEDSFFQHDLSFIVYYLLQLYQICVVYWVILRI